MEPPRINQHLCMTIKKGAFMGIRISCIITTCFSCGFGQLVRDVLVVVYRQVLLHGRWLVITGNAKCVCITSFTLGIT